MIPIPAGLASSLADRCRIERELGHGGMATVYLAEDLRHHRQVAIKVLRPELAAVTGAERFLAEIKTTANLQHPHILPLFDSGSADGLLFYVMPYVEGETLSIAAASILAKTARDDLMHALDLNHPEYGFSKHKGYGTSFHWPEDQNTWLLPHSSKNIQDKKKRTFLKRPLCIYFRSIPPLNLLSGFPERHA